MSIQIPSSVAQILSQQNTFVGTSVYQIAPGATGTVRLIDAPPWLPNPVRVKAWSEIRPGQKLIVGVDDRLQYHAIAHSSSAIISQRSLQFRRYREQPLEQLFFPFKILFSITSNGIREFYIGGDRARPTLVQGLGESYWTRLEVLGAKNPDWLVSQLLPSAQYLAIYGDPTQNKSYAIDGQYYDYAWKGKGIWEAKILGGFTVSYGVGIFRQTPGWNPYSNNTRIGNLNLNVNSTSSYQYATYRITKNRNGNPVVVAVASLISASDSSVDNVLGSASYSMKQSYLLPEGKQSVNIPVTYNVLSRRASSGSGGIEGSTGSRTTTDTKTESTQGSADVYIGNDSFSNLEVNINYSETETAISTAWEYYSKRTRGHTAERIS